MGQEWHDVFTAEEVKKRLPVLSRKLATPGFDEIYDTNASWADAGLPE
jgi:sarcosine oxidase/L-pipecolate oxidase